MVNELCKKGKVVNDYIKYEFNMSFFKVKNPNVFISYIRIDEPDLPYFRINEPMYPILG